MYESPDQGIIEGREPELLVGERDHEELAEELLDPPSGRAARLGPGRHEGHRPDVPTVDRIDVEAARRAGLEAWQRTGADQVGVEVVSRVERQHQPVVGRRHGTPEPQESTKAVSGRMQR